MGAQLKLSFSLDTEFSALLFSLVAFTPLKPLLSPCLFSPSAHFDDVPFLPADVTVSPLAQLLLMENDINTRPFSQAVLNCLPPLPWSVSDADVAKPWRADLRHLRVCSVDPIGASHQLSASLPNFQTWILIPHSTLILMAFSRCAFLRLSLLASSDTSAVATDHRRVPVI